MTGPSAEQLGLAKKRETIAPFIHRTPLWHSHTLSERVGHDVWLKCELLQKTGSYKPRGMLTKLMALSAEEAARGAITFSAGNAAQGLAYAGRILKIPTTIVMPSTASPLKAEATRGYGGEVILYGNPRECWAKAREIAEKRGLAFVSSYDDDDLMAGHASLGLEIVEDLPDVDAIFVGVGGGGMIGGTALALELLTHGANLIGVEPEGAAAMRDSFKAGEAVTLDHVQTIADGLAAPSTGLRCFEVARRRVKDVVVVSDEAIREAMLMLMLRTKLYVEPAGAAALAGLFSAAGQLEPKSKVAVVVSGGNLDLERLRSLLP